MIYKYFLWVAFHPVNNKYPWKYKMFNFDTCLLVGDFGVTAKQSLPNLTLLSVSPMFSSKYFTVQAPMFRSLLHFELIFNMMLSKGPTLFSHRCGCTVFPAPFVEETVMSPLNGHGTLVENHLTMCVQVYFGALFH